MPEQRRIVDNVQQLMALVDALETQLAACVVALSGRAIANAACSAT